MVTGQNITDQHETFIRNMSDNGNTADISKPND